MCPFTPPLHDVSIDEHTSRCESNKDVGLQQRLRAVQTGFIQPAVSMHKVALIKVYTSGRVLPWHKLMCGIFYLGSNSARIVRLNPLFCHNESCIA